MGRLLWQTWSRSGSASTGSCGRARVGVEQIPVSSRAYLVAYKQNLSSITFPAWVEIGKGMGTNSETAILGVFQVLAGTQFSERAPEPRGVFAEASGIQPVHRAVWTAVGHL